MKNLTIARRYAKALFDLAKQENSLDDVLQGLGNVVGALSQSPELSRVLLNPLVKPEQKRDLVAKISSNKLLLKFVMLLAKRERMAQLATIYEALRHLNDQATGVSRVLVRSAAPLSDVQKRLIESELADSTRSRVIGQFEVKDELLGGLWIQMGDKVLDRSLRGRMDDLKHVLTNSRN